MRDVNASMESAGITNPIVEVIDMFTNIRWKLSATLMKKAHDLASTGNFRKVKRGMLFAKFAIWVMPPDLEVITAMHRSLRTSIENTH